MTEIVVVTGAGGVGKTTLSASIGTALAAIGKRTLIITVDPARRLADALGVSLDGAGANRPTQVADTVGLEALMLDLTASWEAITRRHTDPETADRLLTNPYFRAVADRFPAAQSYAAGEQVAEFADSKVWDAIVVDTPPAAGGIDFFVAPRQMRDLIGGRMLRWLTGARIPGRRMLYRATARPMLRIADSVLGSALLEDIADFLIDLRSLYDGMAARAAAIERLFTSATVLVVTTDGPGPMREAGRFFRSLPEIDVRPNALVFNRSLPESWIRARGPQGSSPVDVAVRENMARWRVEARRNRDAREAMAARLDVPLITVPWMKDTPRDLESLRALAIDHSKLLSLVLNAE
ncbi:MAG: ArsA family ATPase [Acidimicrobiia bacterium]|nr:ArsA family ATPase [Acidimicrobiia bacterium]